MPLITKIFLLLFPILIIKLIISRQTITAIVILVFNFILVSFLLLSINIEFIPLILLVIYVGAIAILFLFTIMLIQHTTINLQNLHFPTLILEITIFTLYNLIDVLTVADTHNFSFTDKLCQLDNFQTFSSVIYTQYLYGFILVTILLLIGLIGSLIICLPS